MIFSRGRQIRGVRMSPPMGSSGGAPMGSGAPMESGGKAPRSRRQIVKIMYKQLVY